MVPYWKNGLRTDSNNILSNHKPPDIAAAGIVFKEKLSMLLTFVVPSNLRLTYGKIRVAVV